MGSFTGDSALSGTGGAGGLGGASSPKGKPGTAGAAGSGIGGGLYIAGGTVTVSKKTSFSGNIATTSDPDIFGPYTIS
jgi:hypothetical protein